MSDDKLNDEHLIRMQGGSLLILIKVMSSEVARLEVVEEMGKAMGRDFNVDAKTLEALNAIGHNLMRDAEKIFGRDYLNEVFHGDGEISADEIIAVPDGATIN